MVESLLCSSEDMGLIPDWGARIPHALRLRQKKFKKKKNLLKKE